MNDLENLSEHSEISDLVVRKVNNQPDFSITEPYFFNDKIKREEALSPKIGVKSQNFVRT